SETTSNIAYWVYFRSVPNAHEYDCSLSIKNVLQRHVPFRHTKISSKHCHRITTTHTSPHFRPKARTLALVLHKYSQKEKNICLSIPKILGSILSQTFEPIDSRSCHFVLDYC